MIGLIDYGAGNLQSVANAFEVLGVGHRIIDSPNNWDDLDGIVLPGVGHFGQICAALDAQDLRTALRSWINDDRPYLGICLGLQILFAASEESPDSEGLGIWPAAVQRLQAPRLPHIGWNQTSAGETVYFANSFAAPVVEGTVSTCDYGGIWTASIERSRIWAAQYHPEKSAETGLNYLRRFAEAACS